MKTIVFFIVFLSFQLHAQQSFTKNDLKVSPILEGTLLLPNNIEKPSLAIIIAGSGPTDRNGNQMMMKNNSLKFLAQELSNNGIATFRYDKRIVAMLKKGQMDEKSVKFDDFIEDADKVIRYFKKSNNFGDIYVIGHSQGSLVGMTASKDLAQGFISIAGAGQSIDAVIVSQLEKQAPGLKDNARASFDELREKGSTKNYSPGLSSIFRPDIQPFIHNWMKYNPKEIITALDIPVLIINGDKDLQVHPSEAEILKKIKPEAQLKIIKGMNHVLKYIDGDDLVNQKSYNNPMLPIMQELVTTIVTFIKK